MFASGLLWIVVPGLVALVGAVLFLRGLGHIGWGKAGRGAAHIAVGAPLTVLGLAASLLGFNSLTFERLTHEAPVADVHVKATDPARNLYNVSIIRLDGPKLTQVCRIQGDEWDISARVQKWKPWANMMGLDTTYTLDQVTNRYFTAERGNGKLITACDLRGPPPDVDRWVPKSWVFWLIGHAYTEDRKFGSASFMPLADGATYRVVITQSGLNAFPTNETAAKANDARP
ncbi:MAG TPA: hypothetical protein VGM17_01560 [Rhizomicrobium sp.]|jgi:hypothetical protein